MKIGILLFLVLYLDLIPQNYCLYCYNCDVAVNQNDLCNEAEPIRCQPHQNKCGTQRTSTRLRKYCIHNCPSPERGDNDEDITKCLECNKDLCNKEDRISESTESSSKIITIQTNQSIYTIYDQPSTYWEARMECVQQGLSLANIWDQKTQQIITEKFEKVKKANDSRITKYWVGGRTFTPTSWGWQSTGDVIRLPGHQPACDPRLNFENWAPGKPGWVPENRNYCVYLNPNGTWGAGSCGKENGGFVCENKKDDEAAVTSMLQNGTIFLFHPSPLNYSSSIARCLRHNSKLADLANITDEVIDKLDYVINGKEFWSVSKCEMNPPADLRSGFLPIYSCSRLLPSICEKNFTEYVECPPTTPIVTTQPRDTTQPMTSQELTTSPIIIQAKANPPSDVIMPGCLTNVIFHDGKNFTFPETNSGTFTDSIEVCQSGRPRASIYCSDDSRLVNSTFTLTSCEKSVADIKKEINLLSADNTTSTEDLNTITGDLRLITSQSMNLTSQDIEDTVDVLRTIDQNKSRGDDSSQSNEITSAVLTNILSTTSNVQSRVMTSQKSELGSIVESFIGKAKLNSSYKFMTPELEVKAFDIDETNEVSAQTFHPFNHSTSAQYLTIESNLTSHLNESDVKKLRLFFVAYKDADLFPSEKQVSEIITATVLNEKGEKISVPVSFAFKQDKNMSKEECSTETCSFYNETNQIWSDVGCRTDVIDDTVHCACNHTTSFALVVGVYEDELNSIALHIASEVGFTVCVVFLLLTVILFAKLPELRRVRSSEIHVNLCVVLIFAYSIFMLGVERTHPRYLCVVITAIIHFFLLAAWGWMLAESYTMYRIFVKCFDRNDVTNWKFFAVMIYTGSFIIVLVTIVISFLTSQENEKDCSTPNDMWSNYVGENYCWLKGNSLHFGFLLFVGVALVINIVIAYLVIRAITWGRKKVQSSVEETPAMHVLRALVVAILMGMSWVFAVPIVVSRHLETQVVFSWLFAVSTSVQGLFVFYFFCVRRDDVRKAWMDPIVNLLCCHKKENEGPLVSGKNGRIQSTSSYITTSRSLRINTESRPRMNSERQDFK